jgi:raffinose/stachyose/melibiose transport system substrate-binding protein
VLWFEALMDGKSTSLAQSNVSLLVTGQLSPEDYMSQLQASIEANG